MDLLDELIGFLVILFIFFFPLIRRLLLRKKSAQQPPEEHPEKAAPIHRLPPLPVQKVAPALTAPSSTQRTVKRDYEFHSDLEEFERASQIEARHLDIKVKPQFKEKITSAAFLPPEQPLERLPSHLTQLLRQSSLKKMVVLHEIFQPPKGLE